MSDDDLICEPSQTTATAPALPEDQPNPKLPDEDAPELRPANFHLSISHPPKDPGKPGVKRDGDNVVVFGSDEVMDVFENKDGVYSVHGYARRSEHAFGDFFLGLDMGEDYRQQSTAINEAIMEITMEEGFVMGAEATAEVLKRLDGDPPDAQHLTDGMLARVCAALFGLPDDDLIEDGGFSIHLLPPGRCPGDYAPMSGYIFLPEPGVPLTLAGRHLGRILKKQTLAFVERLRRTPDLPEPRLTRALFKAYPDEADNDLLARTLVGIMMGLLPTTEGNLVQVLKSMHSDGSYYRVAKEIRALVDPLDPKAAADVLRVPMFNAMQACPMPPAVWRTALEDHRIGPVEV
ncbi:MAG: hypothetical protein AAGH83_10060, partial [Pseudomonadota bacterium]